jgi:hypothetical protein
MLHLRLVPTQYPRGRALRPDSTNPRISRGSVHSGGIEPATFALCARPRRLALDGQSGYSHPDADVSLDGACRDHLRTVRSHGSGVRACFTTTSGRRIRRPRRRPPHSRRAAALRYGLPALAASGFPSDEVENDAALYEAVAKRAARGPGGPGFVARLYDDGPRRPRQTRGPNLGPDALATLNQIGTGEPCPTAVRSSYSNTEYPATPRAPGARPLGRRPTP